MCKLYYICCVLVNTYNTYSSNTLFLHGPIEKLMRKTWLILRRLDWMLLRMRATLRCVSECCVSFCCVVLWITVVMSVQSHTTEPVTLYSPLLTYLLCLPSVSLLLLYLKGVGRTLLSGATSRRHWQLSCRLHRLRGDPRQGQDQHRQEDRCHPGASPRCLLLPGEGLRD